MDQHLTNQETPTERCRDRQTERQTVGDKDSRRTDTRTQLNHRTCLPPAWLWTRSLCEEYVINSNVSLVVVSSNANKFELNRNKENVKSMYHSSHYLSVKKTTEQHEPNRGMSKRDKKKQTLRLSSSLEESFN